MFNNAFDNNENKIDDDDRTNRISAQFGQHPESFVVKNKNPMQLQQKKFNRSRQSAETKASSSQSAMRPNMSPKM